ncbi:MAG: hypothetical protein KGK05_02140 [Xanthomonadaceae bacterium]|nr:hypothetical protein [Xanthomonadaceae bacterium]
MLPIKPSIWQGLRFLIVLLGWVLAIPVLAVTNTWEAAAPMATARCCQTATLLPSGKLLVAGGASLGSGVPNAELYDPSTDTWSAAASMANARISHTATLLPSGKVLVTGGVNNINNGTVFSSTELYDPFANTWAMGASMAAVRYHHTATLLPSGKVLVAGGADGTNTPTTSAELYDPATNLWSSAGSMTTARWFHTATLLSSGKVLVEGGADAFGNPLTGAELYDPGTNTWSVTGSLMTARWRQAATLLPSGKVLVAGGEADANGTPLSSAELYDPATSLWSSAGSLATARYSNTVTLLPSGKVLVAGGFDVNGSAVSSTEIYDPTTSTWSAAGSLISARAIHTVTRLPSGEVLVAGGQSSTSNSIASLASAELFDPASEQWSGSGTLIAARLGHTATLLQTGKVLVAGGADGSLAAVSSAELYDPTTGAWSATAGPLSTARFLHTATLLPSGKVLVVGGLNSNGALASAELYDPATGTWTPTGSLATPRWVHTATLLPSGKVLVTGGLTGTGGLNSKNFVASAELYDPARGTWSAAPSMAYARGYQTATLLPSGLVLVAAGDGFSGSPPSFELASAELYDPVANSWSAAGSLAQPRHDHTATLLPSGKVLVTGGEYTDNVSPTILNSAELYDPASNTWSAAGSLAAARQGHTATLLASGLVLVVGGADNQDVTTNDLASAELYDPFSNLWSAAGALATARGAQSATLLPTGLVLAAGGIDNGTVLASAELFDPGLAPDSTRIPDLSAVNASLLQGAQLLAVASGSTYTAGATTTTGFMPLLEAGGGTTHDSGSNSPVFQIQRLDNEQTRFIPNDETVDITDTSFTGAANALMCFPPGPARVRAWVNGVPSATQSVVVTSDTIFENGFEVAAACPY